MNLKGLTYKELLGLIQDVSNEFSERFHKEPKDHADEFVAIKDMEIAAGDLRRSLENSGKMTITE